MISESASQTITFGEVGKHASRSLKCVNMSVLAETLSLRRACPRQGRSLGAAYRATLGAATVIRMQLFVKVFSPLGTANCLSQIARALSRQIARFSPHKLVTIP
jgi:hypothetical protein